MILNFLPCSASISGVFFDYFPQMVVALFDVERLCDDAFVLQFDFEGVAEDLLRDQVVVSHFLKLGCAFTLQFFVGFLQFLQGSLFRAELLQQLLVLGLEELVSLLKSTRLCSAPPLNPVDVQV